MRARGRRVCAGCGRTSGPRSSTRCWPGCERTRTASLSGQPPTSPRSSHPANTNHTTYHQRGNKQGRNVLFNDALNTFYLRLYGVGHMVKDHSDSEKGNPLPPHRLLLSINSKGSFICTILDRITHTTTFVTPVVEHWLERELKQTRLKKERSLIKQYTHFLPKNYFSSIGQNNSKQQKQTSKLLILTETAAW